MSDIMKSDQLTDSLEDDPLMRAGTAEPPISPATGLKILKEVWDASNRLASLSEKYHGKAIPPMEVLGALFGFGDEPNPLAKVEQQLAEINAKLDRVLAGIEEIKRLVSGNALLTAYLSMERSLQAIGGYFDDLPDYIAVPSSKTSEDLTNFVNKLLGLGTQAQSESVQSHIKNIIKIDTGKSLFLELLFDYIVQGTTAQNVRLNYLKGAFLFRHIASTMMKGMMLETFAISADTNVGRAAGRADALAKVTKRYREWMDMLVTNSFLPFAETMATFRFREEYMGDRSDTDINIPWKSWTRPVDSILESADTLAASLEGEPKSVTLRVLANLPPIGDNKIPATPPGEGRVVYAGTFRWSPLSTSAHKLSKATMLDELLQEQKPPFFIYSARKNEAWPVAATRTMIVAPVKPPRGFETNTPCIRYRFNIASFGDGEVFTFYQLPEKANKPPFAPIQTQWERIYDEEGHMWRDALLDCTYYILNSKFGEFELPAEGHLSPVLVTYAYERFGQRPKKQMLGEEESMQEEESESVSLREESIDRTNWKQIEG